jgi:hypothetical protein
MLRGGCPAAHPTPALPSFLAAGGRFGPGGGRRGLCRLPAARDVRAARRHSRRAGRRRPRGARAGVWVLLAGALRQRAAICPAAPAPVPVREAAHRAPVQRRQGAGRLARRGETPPCPLAPARPAFQPASQLSFPPGRGSLALRGGWAAAPAASTALAHTPETHVCAHARALTHTHPQPPLARCRRAPRPPRPAALCTTSSWRWRPTSSRAAPTRPPTRTAAAHCWVSAPGPGRGARP